MKKAGIAVMLVGLLIIIATSFRPAYYNDKVHNWSPVNGMVVTGLGALLFIGGTKPDINRILP